MENEFQVERIDDSIPLVGSIDVAKIGDLRMDSFDVVGIVDALVDSFVVDKFGASLVDSLFRVEKNDDSLPLVAGSFPVERIAGPLFDDLCPLSADFCPFPLKPDSLPLVVDSFQVDDRIADSCLLVADLSVNNLSGADLSLVGSTVFEIAVVVVEIVEIFHFVDSITNPKNIDIFDYLI